MSAKVWVTVISTSLALLGLAFWAAELTSPANRSGARPIQAEGTVTTAGPELLASPVFSLAAGFYTNAVDLKLIVSDREAEIRFTLDGTEPTPASPLYQKPLRLGGRAGTRNTISGFRTVPGGPTAAGEVFKGWVVRARSFQTGAKPSAVVTATFWVDPRGRQRYSLPVVSLVTDPAHFFDSRTGIYVPGRALNGNYSKRGPQWARPVHVELYETNNQCAFSQEARAKIHGNTSQMWPIKALDLRASGAFRDRIFPDRERTRFKHLLLRPSGQDQDLAFMRDELVQSLAAEAGLETQAARACVLFINGEYWGLNYLKEKEDTEFVSAAASHSKNEIDYLDAVGDTVTVRAGQAHEYRALMEFLRRHNLSNPDDFGHVAQAVDLANYINYKCSEIFAYRWDINQLRLWRPRSAGARWRWLSFDGDVAWGGFWSHQPPWRFNMLAAVLATDGSLHEHNTETTTLLLRRLTEHPEFRRDFVNRFQDLLNSMFLPSHTLARIDQLESVLAPEMEEHIARWSAPASLAEWKRQLENLRTFARQRPQYTREHLRMQFGLQAACPVAVGLQPREGGLVRLNTLSVHSDEIHPWTGLYFRGHPLTLEARPAPGFRFAGWVGSTNCAANPLIFSPATDCALTARFVQDNTSPGPVSR